MIKRIVKMEFESEKVNAFMALIELNKNKIENSEGCISLEILQDIDNENIFFTYSCWQSEKDLNHYRESNLFKQVWLKTKTYFSSKPSAWSVKII